MARRKKKPQAKRTDPRLQSDHTRPVGLRIIGGTFRGRKLQYGGLRQVRPMKDRLREALFNLVGPSIRGKWAVDLFAGTGAVGLEAISRGAARATLIEQHYPTAKILRQNVATLAVEAITQVVTADTFVWSRQQPELGTIDAKQAAWAVFCSPPYDFYERRRDEILELIGRLLEAAPPESIFAVEADDRFDFALLPDSDAWDVRRYRPAVVGVYRKPGREA